MISGLLDNVASGSATAIPSTGSATADYLTGLPALFTRVAAGFLGTLGS